MSRSISASWDSLLVAACELPADLAECELAGRALNFAEGEGGGFDADFVGGERGVFGFDFAGGEVGGFAELVGLLAELGGLAEVVLAGLAGVVLAGLAGVVLVRRDADAGVVVVGFAGVVGFTFELDVVLAGVGLEELGVGETDGRDEGRLGALKRAARAACCCFLSMSGPACSGAIGVGVGQEREITLAAIPSAQARLGKLPSVWDLALGAGCATSLRVESFQLPATGVKGII